MNIQLDTAAQYAVLREMLSAYQVDSQLSRTMAKARLSGSTDEGIAEAEIDVQHAILAATWG